MVLDEKSSILLEAIRWILIDDRSKLDIGAIVASAKNQRQKLTYGREGVVAALGKTLGSGVDFQLNWLG